MGDIEILKEEKNSMDNQMSGLEKERLSEVRELREQLEQTQLELEEKESHSNNLYQTNHELQDQMSSLNGDNTVLREKLEKSMGDIEILKEEKNSMKTKLHNICFEGAEMKENEAVLLEKNQCLQNELNQLLTRISSLIDDNDGLQDTLKDKETKERDVLLTYNDQRSVIRKHEETILVYKQKSEELEYKNQLFESLSLKMSEAEDDALAELNDLHGKLDIVHNTLHEKKAEATDFLSKNTLLQGQMVDLSTEISVLHENLQNTAKQNEEVEKRNEAILDDLDMLQKEKDTLKIKLQESLEENEVLRERSEGEAKELHVLRTEQQHLERCLRERSEELREFKISRDVETKKQSDSCRETEILKKDLSQYQTKTSNEQPDERNENELCAELNELKLLLASSNNREKEAEEIAVAAERELEEKEQEIEELIKIASDRDAAAKEMEDKVTMLQNQLSSSTTQDHDQLLKHDMELLMGEKLALEDRLDAEIRNRVASEKELKEQMGGEQRALVRQAEMKMSSLRDELASLKRVSEHHDMKAHCSKQEVEKLKEIIEHKNNEHAASNQLITDLKAKLETAEQSFSDISQKEQNIQDEYDAFKEHAALARDNIKSNFNTKLHVLREERQKLREILHEKGEETQSAKNKMNLYKDQANQLRHDLEATKQSLFVEKDLVVSKLKEEIAKGKVYAARLEAEILSYKQEIRKMKSQYNDIMSKMKDAKKIHMSMITENGLLDDQIKALESNVEKLKSTFPEGESEVVRKLKEDIEMMTSKIKSKDERIKSLHSKVLTKDQVAKIKGLKVSRVYDHIISFLSNALNLHFTRFPQL